MDQTLMRRDYLQDRLNLKRKVKVDWPPKVRVYHLMKSSDDKYLE